MVVATTAENLSTFMPFLTIVGAGGLVGYLIGMAIKYVLKFLAIIAGLFLAALMYLQSQGVLNINWTKIQTIFQPAISSLTNSLNSTTTMATGHNNGTTTATDNISNLIHSSVPFMPLDMGLPLVGSAGLGFILGLTRR